MDTKTFNSLNVVIVVSTNHSRQDEVTKNLIDLDDWADATNEEYEESIHRILGHTQFTLNAIHRPNGSLYFSRVRYNPPVKE